MKKILLLTLILSLILVVIMISSCDDTTIDTVPESTTVRNTQTEPESKEATNTQTEPESTKIVNTETEPESEEVTETQTESESTEDIAIQTDSETTEVVTVTQTETESTISEEPQVIPTNKPLKILAIGNSFSCDAMEYVYDIAKDLGYEEIILGNLYIGGCSLKTHASNLKSTSNSYIYFYNTSGKWEQRNSNITAELTAEEWDYVSIQQVSGDSGRPDTYEPYLTEIINYVKEKAPQAKIFWHMTWAYPTGSNYSSFSNYGYDQATMYNAITSTVQSKILTKDEISFVIPSGTAIQNVRTSYFGDNVSRDGLHLSYDIGRYIASMMWVKQITGANIDDVEWIPSITVTPRLLDVIKEAVNNACKKPYEVTVATDKQAETLNEVIEMYGIDASKYTVLDLGLIYKAYYCSTNTSEIYSAENGSTASNLTQFACTKMFEKADLPNGSLIILVNGYQYRPEGWKNLSSVNTSSNRPGNVFDNVVIVNDEWWGEFEYRAFNIAKKGNPNLTDDEMSKLGDIFAILVPNDPNAEIYTLPDTEKIDVDVEKMVQKAGYDYSEYDILDYDITLYAYYNSTVNANISSRAGGSTASNLNQFAATSEKFTKEQIPVGSLIVIANGFQYRPEGWINLNTKNSSANRPANVTTSVTEVTDAWWGSFTLRAFNIAQRGNPALSDDQMSQLEGVLFILVPKAQNG